MFWHLGFFVGLVMKKILVLIFALWAMPSFAACPDEFLLTPPQQHEVIGCTVKNDGAQHFSIFDASHRAMILRKQGLAQNIQFKYTGDWLITPTRIQLVPYYLTQVRKFGGKLIFEDETKATYKYFADQKSYWMELAFVGDGIHTIQQISQEGINLDAQYNVGQMKSRMKRYGKVVFYDLVQNQASFEVLVEFLRGDERKFYIVSHVYGEMDNEQKSRHQALILYEMLFKRGIDTDQIMVKSVGDLSPIKNPTSLNAVQKNTRIELVLHL